MSNRISRQLQRALVVGALGVLVGCTGLQRPGPPCGPQSPRDISRAGGTNTVPVPGDGTRPPRLCNVHFHKPAEHAGIGACPAVPSGETGGVCAGEGHEAVQVGDEIEVHWVYTSCPEPGTRKPGLENCVCGSQEGPDPMVLMVFGQKYVVSPAGQPGAHDRLIEPGSDLARYGGSTTGPSFSDGSRGSSGSCSPFKVQWAVARQCQALTLSALGDWCKTNEWDEHHAHGIRGPVTREDWLSPYTPPGQ